MISVIIVNFNGIKFLEACLRSVIKQLEDLTHEIILVDNDSKDQSIVFIKENFPMVIIIESKENLGFGKANNLGVANANGETLLLINNDTILLNNIKPAVEVLYSDESYGIVTINMLDKNQNYIPAVGKFPSPLRMLKISFSKDNRKEFTYGNFNLKQNYTVDWVTGAFMLIRKNDYLDLQGFDPDYFMYVEDVDLCKRMNNLRKLCVFVPYINYIHFVGHNTKRNILLMNGYKTYCSKHFSGISKFIALKMISINIFIKKLTNNI